jgi:PAP2 superfamily C-terminal
MIAPPTRVRYGVRLLVRTLVVVVGLGAWFWTQALIGSRVAPDDVIGDGILDLLAGPNLYLQEHPTAAHGLLIASSAVIDVLGIFLLGMSIFGPTVRPFLALLLLFALRQACQALCALRAPPGMIWLDPGMPSLLVTYQVATDFFFSGHTGLAMIGAIELVRVGGRRWVVVGVAIVLFESIAVLLLRAHYTMDVFTGAVVGHYVAILAARWAPTCDRWLGRAARSEPRPLGSEACPRAP